MSQYYAPYNVLGLVILNDEIEEFKNNYIKQNLKFLKKDQDTDDIKEIEESVEEWITCNELLFADEEKKEHALPLIFVSPDMCDGMVLYPASNYNKELKYNAIELRGDDCLIIEASYQPSTIQILAGDPFYQSYDELLSEFKTKLKNLLPDDFPYEDRIGDFSYACYA